MKKSYDYIVYIGRFQPFHNGHLGTLNTAFKLANKVILLLGSSNSPRTPKNPWTADERESMIRSCLSVIDNNNMHVRGIEDRLYADAKWQNFVRTIVKSIVSNECSPEDGNPSIALIAHDKDESSYYTREFPEWPVIETGAHIKERNIKIGKPISSTKIRELIFTDHMGYIESNVPAGVYRFIEDFSETSAFENVKGDFEHYFNEERDYIDKIPYHMNFYTADPVVIQSGHVLMIKRKKFPGKDLWALPGGHVEVNETSFEASLRELDQETSINVPKGKLIGSLSDFHLFDHPDRSLRCRLTTKLGRTVSTAYLYKLDGTKSSGESVSKLPKVRGGSDAKEARWFTYDEIANMRSEIFEDHADIIDYFVSRLPSKNTSTW